jgi:hypothetical protein
VRRPGKESRTTNWLPLILTQQRFYEYCEGVVRLTTTTKDKGEVYRTSNLVQQTPGGERAARPRRKEDGGELPCFLLILSKWAVLAT